MVALDDPTTAAEAAVTTTATDTARTAITAMLSGEAPNGAQPDALVEWADIYAALAEAYADSGAEGVRAAWGALIKATPGLAAFVSGDDLLDDNTFADWQPICFDDIDKPEPRPAIVPGLFYRGTLSSTFGAPGSIKSFVVADLAVCVAAGIPWLVPTPGNKATEGLCEYPILQGPVVWIDFDNGNYTTRERFYALKMGHNLRRSSVPLFVYTMPTPWLDLSDETHAVDFSDWLCALPEKPSLVVIDNLSYVAGSLSTNDDLMKNVMAALKHAAETAVAHVIVIHHERKGNGTKGRAGERLRGSSAIEAGLDLALLFERDGDVPTVKITATKNRILRSFPTLGVTLRTEHDDENIMSMAHCWQTLVVDGDKSKVEAEVTAILTKEGSVQKTNLAKLAAARAGVGVNKVRSIVGAMIEAGDLMAVVDENARGKPIVVSLAS